MLAMRRQRGEYGVWVLTGAALWSAGLGIGIVHAIERNPTFPHEGHLLWALGLPLLVVGTFRSPGQHRNYVGPMFVFDLVLVGSAWLLAVWRVVIWRPDLAGAHEVGLQLAVMVVDLVLAAVVVQLTANTPTPPMMMLAVGIILLVIGDAVVIRNGGFPDPYLRIALMVAGALVILAGLVLMRTPPLSEQSADRTRGLLTMTLVISGMAVYMIAMAGHQTDPTSQIIAALVLCAYGSRELYRGRLTRRLVAQLARQALIDPLTGLGNRRALAEELQRAVGNRQPVCVVSLDVDRFKEVNRHLGHPVGDQVLVAVADLLRQHCPGVPFRLGGDEFAVLTQLAEAEAVEGADGLRAVAAEEISKLPGVEQLAITLSIGIAAWRPDDDIDPLEVLTRSSHALRSAKTERNRVRVYSEADARRTELASLLEQRLRRAVGEGEITFAFQPIVRLPEATATGVEVLARWDDAVLGRVAPDEFIPVAEQTGLIHELGRQCLQAGLDAIVAQRDRGRELRVSVNVSPVQLRRATFGADLDRMLLGSRVAPQELTIEVTEGVFIDLDDPAVTMLHRLAGRGVTIAIDDFGTGYSSLGYMTRLPAHVIKVDKSLTERVSVPRPRSIVKALLGVAKAHDLDVIMEGVDSEQDAAILVELGVRKAQGWLWSAAVGPDQLDTVLDRLTAPLATRGGS